MLRKIQNVAPIILSALFLLLALRGMLGAPNEFELNDSEWKQSGPFELSPERGRFALIYSIVENNSFYFSVPLARFVAPDLGYSNGNYVSLFAPGVSIISVPGYVLGKFVGASQIGTVATISVFAILNLLIIKSVSGLLGAKPRSGTLAGFIFLFATPAFVYAVTLYQHHISTFIILASVYLLIKYNNWLSVLAIWFLAALALIVDYPNFFMILPVALFALTKFAKIKINNEQIKIKFKLTYTLTFLGAILPITTLLLFNYFSFGNPLQLSGTVSSVIALDTEGFPTLPDNIEDNPEVIHKLLNPEEQDKSFITYFFPRNIVQGLYIHTLSLDRGILIYTPVVILGIIGAFILYKKSNPYIALLTGVLVFNLVLYSMWGDPWGGWAFGSRYLIPSYAILCIFLSIFISNFPPRRLARWAFRIILIYSIAVNTLGAITTSANPPKVEATLLEPISGRRERYTFIRNWEYLRDAGSKSFVYKEFVAEKVGARIYYLVLLTLISGTSLWLLSVVYPKK